MHFGLLVLEEEVAIRANKTHNQLEDDDFSQLSLFEDASIVAVSDNEVGNSFSVKDTGKELLPAITVGQQVVLPKRGFPPSETPQGRLIEHGARYLSATELLSLLVGGRTPQQTATEIITCLNEHGISSDSYLRELHNVTVEELVQYPGVGPKKAAEIVAAVELGRRLFSQHVPKGDTIDDPAVAAAALSTDLMWQQVEKFGVVYLNTRHNIIGKEIITKGTANETPVFPRDVFRNAVRRNATRIIVAHNHPSGSLEPSGEDIRLTEHLITVGESLCIPVLDHLILGNGDFSSLRQMNADLWSKDA